MKYFRLEPTYKKSVIEWTIFTRKNEEDKDIFLRKELGWRWGTWLISVPDTEEEALEYIESKGYKGNDAVFEWASDHGHTVLDDNDNEILDPDASVVDMVTWQMLPSEEDEFVDITEDYEDAEMLECWDGCWEFWHIDSYQVELDEDTKQAWVEEAIEVYTEDHEEGVENIGWAFLETSFEFHCPPNLIPCDEQGTPLEDVA